MNIIKVSLIVVNIIMVKPPMETFKEGKKIVKEKMIGFNLSDNVA